ncbi:MAG: hypothetical protein AB7L84_08775 [Acidimicrobiia bacterium]
MELDGTWSAAVADDELRRRWQLDGFDASDWEQVEVPGHWQSTPAFAASEGPLLYRRPFEAAGPDPGRRRWLVVDGLFYQGDVWLDGEYLGDTEGYFVPHAFEVTAALAARRDHVLAVEVTCARPPVEGGNRNVTGVLQRPGEVPLGWNPGGIWRPVRLEETGPVRIARLRVGCREADERRAVVELRARLDADAARSVELRTRIGDVEHETRRTVAAGANEVAWTVTVDRPRLWWPRALGQAALVPLAVTVLLPDEGGEPSHRREVRTGLREVRRRDGVLSVNGERLFVKGVNLAPTRPALAAATAAELHRDVELAADAGLDLVRLRGHVSRPELYDRADEVGLLVWQDLPLSGPHPRNVRRQAARQATEMVDLLGHHPSIVLWCGHDDAAGADDRGAPVAAAALVAGRTVARAAPRWGRTVLDRTAARALRDADGTRAVVGHADAPLRLGWRGGDERDLAAWCRAVPRLARGLTGFGTASVPEHAGFCGPERWPDLDWEELAAHHGLEEARFRRYVPPDGFATFEDWAAATRRHQAEVGRRQAEHLRRLKYRPAGGFLHALLRDPAPAVSAALVDHEGACKPAFAALRAASQPIVVVADRLPVRVRPGEALALDVHVVSDLRTVVEDVEVTARASWDGGAHAWRWRGDVPADACVRVATLQLVAPDVEGPLHLDLTCAYDGVEVAGGDETSVVREA